MNPNPDPAIDKVLTGLRNTPTPTGLATRINARLLQAAESPSRGTPFASPMQITWAGAACAAVLALAVLATHHQSAPPVADLSSETAPPALPVPATTRVAPRLSVGSHGPATNRVPQGFSLGSHWGSTKDEGVLTPDAIALAETLAPSHPAPPLPLTEQEALLVRSTRPGQPIELAELETRRISALTQVAEARERNTVREYIHGLLGPLATAETLTSSSPPSDDNKPVADSEIPPSK